MILKDRVLLAQLMENRSVSARQLAGAVGWKSHSYMNRLLSGQVKTLRPDAALRIAHYFHVPVDLLFLVRSSTDSGQSVKHRSKVA